MATPVAAAAMGMVAVAVVFALFIFQIEDAAPPPPPLAGSGMGSGMGSGQPIDLSSLTPLQAADRLFNRIMMASEQGNDEEALRFVPMALQAYGLVDTLDADARYHLGRIHATAGDIENTRKQIDILKQQVPNHLLGIMLEHDIADQTRDRDGAAQAYAAFLAAYEAEMATGRQEYAAHQSSIETFRATAGASYKSTDGVGSIPALTD